MLAEVSIILLTVGLADVAGLAGYRPGGNVPEDGVGVVVVDCPEGFIEYVQIGDRSSEVVGTGEADHTGYLKHCVPETGILSRDTYREND